MASEKITAMIEEVKALTVLELSELVKALEEEFGVTIADEELPNMKTVGDIVRVRILDVNPEAKRISLSIRDAADYGDSTELPEGDDIGLGDLPSDEEI